MVGPQSYFLLNFLHKSYFLLTFIQSYLITQLQRYSPVNESRMPCHSADLESYLIFPSQILLLT